MNQLVLPACLALLVGCGGSASYVHSDTTLGRIVVYRNGVAYFERHAHVEGDTLELAVPADKVDDFLKSLTVVDAHTGEPAPIAYPTQLPSSKTGLIGMNIQLSGRAPHELRLSYVTESPSWKPSYRIVLGKGDKVMLEAWAIVDNTSGEDWNSVKLGVGASSALSFRYDLRSVRHVQRETLRSDDLFAQAPPTGGASYATTAGLPGQPAKKVVGELSDELLAAAADDLEGARADKKVPASKPKREEPASGYGTGMGRGAGAAAPKSAMPAPSAPAQRRPAEDPLDAMAQNLRSSSNQVIVEGYADPSDGDGFASSLERANRVRDKLIRNGLRPDQVVAVGQGARKERAGGVRIVEAPPPPPETKDAAPSGGEEPAAPPAEPLGTSHFESSSPMSVPRGTSAMVSILKTETEGEVVYLYDPETPRGHVEYPFRSVRIENPTDSSLESGPVTVFGEGKFIGEGLSEPIPAHSTAFIPFALDRQIVVERKEAERDEIARILTVQRGVFSTEVQHTKKTTLTLHNRLGAGAAVYVRHTVAPGYALTKAPSARERLGAAYLFRVEVPARGKVDVVLEEATPLFKSADIRSSIGMELVRVYLSAGSARGPLETAVAELMKLQQEIGSIEQHIETTREQMAEYRARMDELHAQVLSLKIVKTGGMLMQSLEKKLQEVSDKLSKATIDLVNLQEKLMVARIRFQDSVADLSLEKAAAPPPAAAPKG